MLLLMGKFKIRKIMVLHKKLYQNKHNNYTCILYNEYSHNFLNVLDMMQFHIYSPEMRNYKCLDKKLLFVNIIHKSIIFFHRLSS
jgi:hypothetical protein